MSTLPSWRVILTMAAALGVARLSIGPAAGAGTESETSRRAPAGVPGEELFKDGTVRRIHIELLPAAMQTLGKSSRSYVRASIREGTTRFETVALHLKGAKGSFRKLEEKPGFTLDFDRFAPGQTFYGLRRIHLNNSVEDPSYLKEKIGSDSLLSTLARDVSQSAAASAPFSQNS